VRLTGLLSNMLAVPGRGVFFIGNTGQIDQLR
jgi:hypothetical protein